MASRGSCTLDIRGIKGNFFRLIDAVKCNPDLTPQLTETVNMLVALVKGELTTDASSPLDYVVSGIHSRTTGLQETTRDQEGTQNSSLPTFGARAESRCAKMA